METNEQTIRLFSRALLHSMTVLVSTRDIYAYRSLQDVIEYCTRVAVQSSCEGRVFVGAIRELHHSLQEVTATQTESLKSLLLAERHVLLLLVHMTSVVASNQKTVPSSMTPRDVRVPKVRNPESVKIIRTSGKKEQLSASAQQVFIGVQKTEPVRAKDIIKHCSPMSERTVRRSLSELVSAGHVVKDARNGAVHYKISH